MAYMLGRQQIFLELDEDVPDYDELTELMSNSHLNNNFLALAREVSKCTVVPTMLSRMNTEVQIRLNLLLPNYQYFLCNSSKKEIHTNLSYP